MRAVTSIPMIPDASEQKRLEELVSFSSAYVQASSAPLFAYVACSNPALYQFSIVLLQGNAWTQRFVPLDRGRKLLEVDAGQLLHRLMRNVH